MLDFCGGFYDVGNRPFTSKLQACAYATENKQPITWRYFDDVWLNAVRQPASTFSLPELYKLRAQQLRDKHDYLILSYSGGSDSWTILNAFVEAKLFIDEIVVNWPTKATQGPDAIYQYIPNTKDKSSANYLSEWDLFIVDDLEMIRHASPKTKITIQDWSELIVSDPPSADEVLTKPVFHDLIQQRIIGIKTTSEIAALAEGKSVGYIYGADKPRLFKQGDNCYLHFTDGSVRHNVSPATYGSRIEYFFMSPDMPEVAVETARTVFNWFNEGQSPTTILDEMWVKENWQEYVAVSRRLTRPEYDFDRFQSAQPSNQGVNNDKYPWVRIHPAYSAEFARWDAIMDEHYSKIGDEHLIRDARNKAVGLYQNMSMPIPLGRFKQ